MSFNLQPIYYKVKLIIIFNKELVVRYMVYPLLLALSLLTGCYPQDKLVIEKLVINKPDASRASMQIIPTPNKLVAVMYADKIFQANSAKWHSGSLTELNKLLQLINNTPRTHHIDIVAYDDNGKSSKTQLLQANNIAAYLWNHGVSHKMITASSGKNMVSNNISPTGRADNRRIEISLVYQQTPPLV